MSAASSSSRVIIAPNENELAETAARLLLARLKAATARAAVCLTGGSTPQVLYRLLASRPYRDEIPWARVHWFMGDDRFVPQADPLSNMGAARNLLLDRFAQAGTVHAIPTDLDSPQTAALAYQRTLQDFYGATRLHPLRPLFDVVLMGVGGDGHTASLFPGAPALDETDAWVVGVDVAGMEPYVPRVTLTYPTLESCRDMLMLASGLSKRPILTRIADGEDVPAARLRPTGELTWIIDHLAAPEGLDD
ncbi:MAG TPA: 6-phosphogluconolactonase [Xanthobacteraceae bacterium]|nr:6-phosphogluconolactonase [Xanthobacteraceae bacterium]